MSTVSYNKDKIRFLLLEGIHEKTVKMLEKNDYHNIVYFKESLPEEKLIEEIQQAFFIGIRSRTKLTKNVLEHAKKLLCIGCFCNGTDQVDLNFAAQNGIPVFNAPFSNTRSVAELVLGEAIILCRSIPEKNYLAHKGIWKKSVSNATEVRDKTLGIVGYGNIGMQLGVLAEAIGMKVCFYDTEPRLPLGNANRIDYLPTLLQHSDIVSLHVPDTNSTQALINEDTLKMMKKNAILINASRGKVVDVQALAHCLKSGHLAGAAIDVFPQEPKNNQETFTSVLQGIHNVILTPHIGGSTQEAQALIGEEVAEKFMLFCNRGSTISSVNFPQVSLPMHPNRHRILHIHQNIPGILTEINHTFSELQVNISGQYLQTKGDIGYVVTDIDLDYQKNQVKEHLLDIKGTIRVRFLF